jgi:D-allose transport system substrate-binding protein
VAQLPYLVGKQAVETVGEVLDGKEVETFQYVTTLVLTQDVLEDGSEPLLEFVK